MTRDQQQARRELVQAELKFLASHGWTVCDSRGERVTHRDAPDNGESAYTRRAAIIMTDMAPLRYTVARGVPA